MSDEFPVDDSEIPVGNTEEKKRKRWKQPPERSKRNKSGLRYPSEVIKKRALTTIERKVILAKTKNPGASMAEVGKIAGLKGTSRSQQVSTILRKERVQRALRSIMEERPDLHPSRLLDKLAEGLDAQRHVVVGSGGCAVLNTVPDLQTQRGFLELAFRIRGDLGQKEDGESSANTKLNLALIIVEERNKRGLPPIDIETVDVEEIKKDDNQQDG